MTSSVETTIIDTTVSAKPFGLQLGAVDSADAIRIRDQALSGQLGAMPPGMGAQPTLTDTQ